MYGEYRIRNKEANFDDGYYDSSYKWHRRRISSGIELLAKLLKELKGKTKWLIVDERYIPRMGNKDQTVFLVRFELKDIL